MPSLAKTNIPETWIQKLSNLTSPILTVEELLGRCPVSTSRDANCNLDVCHI